MKKGCGLIGWCWCFLSCSLMAGAAMIHPDQWQVTGGGYGLNDAVFALALDATGSNLYVGGSFSMAGSVPAAHVAAWNTHDEVWSTLSEGVNGHVHALGIAPDGSLYVGGDFTEAGGQPAAYIARWNPDTATWHSLGGGLNGEVDALTVDAAGRVYVGGAFTSAGGQTAWHVAAWDPDTAAWSPLGGGVDDQVYAIATGTNGHVYAGGIFTSAGGNPASYIAEWDGTNWLAMGGGMDDVVAALETDQAGNVYAAGYFLMAGGTASRAVARWDGANWQPMPLGVSCHAISLDYHESEQAIYAAGWVTCSAGDDATRVIRWKDGVWEGVLSVNGMITAVLSDAVTNVYAAGLFTAANLNSTCHGITRWDGATAHPLGDGLDGAVDALAASTDGRVYAGGWFREIAGNTNCLHVAMWDSDTLAWTNLGDGADGGVLALAVDQQHRLWAGGIFTHVDGVAADRVARWDGSSWTNLGAGFNGVVHALAVASNQDVYAAGCFTASGTQTVAHVARWTGTTWTNLGAGIPGDHSYFSIFAMTLDQAGHLYVGGWFTNSGGTKASNIAMWDLHDETWSNLGVGVSESLEVYALATDAAGRLYAGGCFTNAGPLATSHIAMWKPEDQTWTNLGSGVNCRVRAIEIDADGDVVVGGEFTQAGGQPAYGIARWDGTNWFPLGVGVEGLVYALESDHRGWLHVGGDFRVAGGKNSAYAALFIPAQADEDDDALPDWWELHMVGGVTNADPDALAANGTDSVRDIYLADLDPNDPAAELPEPLLTSNAEGSPVLSLAATSPYRRYRVEAIDDLTATPQQWWSSGEELEGNGGALMFALTNGPPHQFYRTSVRAP